MSMQEVGVLMCMACLSGIGFGLGLALWFEISGGDP